MEELTELRNPTCKGEISLQKQLLADVASKDKSQLYVKLIQNEAFSNSERQFLPPKLLILQEASRPRY